MAGLELSVVTPMENDEAPVFSGNNFSLPGVTF
jgi:hypothetical protein